MIKKTSLQNQVLVQVRVFIKNSSSRRKVLFVTGEYFERGSKSEFKIVRGYRTLSRKKPRILWSQMPDEHPVKFWKKIQNFSIFHSLFSVSRLFLKLENWFANLKAFLFKECKTLLEPWMSLMNFNIAVCLAQMEGGCLGYPGDCTVASQPLDTEYHGPWLAAYA